MTLIELVRGPRGRKARIVAALACVTVVLVLSLLPARDMVRTGAPKVVEHFTAYLFTGFMCAMAHDGRMKTNLVLAPALIGLAGMMELAQRLSPGRTPFLSDLLASSLGGCLGVLLAALIVRQLALRRGEASYSAP